MEHHARKFLDIVMKIGGGDLEDRRCTTGFVFMIEEGAISWSSKR
jgi:hypothetical protein